MSKLDFQLTHRLNAVIGWIELGNLKEARLELQSIPPESVDAEEVLDLAWLLYAREGDWPHALEIGERFIKAHPASPAGWLHRAYAMRRVPEGGLANAAKLLLPAFELFPAEPTIPFNLACYACQMDELDQARRWLQEAFNRGERAEIKTMALNDSDLEKLWPEIRSW